MKVTNISVEKSWIRETTETLNVFEQYSIVIKKNIGMLF